MKFSIIDGKALVEQTRKEIKEKIKELGKKPGLAVIIVGENPASKIYVKKKVEACSEVGILSEKYELPDDVSEKELFELIEKLNRNDKINGILVQLPLPEHINEDAVINAIVPEKDVDGFHPANVGRMLIGQDTFVSATPKGIIRLIESTGKEIEGKHAVVIGRSNIVGKPTAILLLQKNATVTVCHSRTKDIEEITKQADIIVVAIGKPKFLKADMVKENVIVIDVGINRVNGKLFGDVDFDEVKKKASFITPLPGGVGPMTIAMLLENTLKAAGG